MGNFSSSKKMRLIVDVDTGVDDAMALVLALREHRRGEATLEAVTTVAGNTDVRNVATNTCRLLQIMKMTEVKDLINRSTLHYFLTLFLNIEYKHRSLYIWALTVPWLCLKTTRNLAIGAAMDSVTINLHLSLVRF